MVAMAIKLSSSSVAAVTRPLAVPRAASAEPRSQSKPANVLEIGDAEMRLCHADRAAGTDARKANASPADLTSELVLRWGGVTRSSTDNTFRRLQISTSTDGDRSNAATRARRNRIEWRLTLLGTTVSEPAYQGFGSRLPACWRIEKAACSKQSMQMQGRTPRDDAGERRPHVERFTESSAQRAKNAGQMVRDVRCGLEISQEEHSPHQRPLLDVGLRNGKVVKHGFARNSRTHQFLTYFKPTAGRWLNCESGGLGDPFDGERGAAA
jgi:hypothetical protein